MRQIDFVKLTEDARQRVKTCEMNVEVTKATYDNFVKRNLHVNAKKCKAMLDRHQVSLELAKAALAELESIKG